MRKLTVGLVLLALVCLALALVAQAPQQTPPAQQKPPAQKPAEQKPPVDVGGGPERPVGETVNIPRKTAPPQKQKPRTPTEQPKVEGQPYSISVNVDLVSVDVVVQDKQGHFVSSLTKQNFRVLEDGVPQQLKTCSASEAPMTVVLLVEFNNRFQTFWSETWYQTLTASYGFLQSLRKEDWIAVVAYDMRSEIIQDFTQNKEEAMGNMKRLQYPGFSEANLFDALDDVLQRLKEVDGKKGVVLISTGIDTFSRLTYDKILKEVQSAQVPIYPIGMMQALRIIYESRMSSIANLDFLQADNAMKTFAAYSGGSAYFPRFYGEFPEIYNNISARMRNQYTLTYTPINTSKDGKFRKLKVDLVDEKGGPLKMVDQKGKEVKYVITARNGYYAPKGEILP